ncbi:Y-family DNA polymerase [Geochorda subterranea]|uniref:UmuC domain-containing protein n=1 Tax=Geochorda subterranea TaxID=3109564 RepID=A0ABZ1BMP0_9FIRM|nr:hypothetical protein [Limnochorda sp. LNt]WRP14094.1 hypothetical protein VLY81_11780 [Limnochorda sp. LNt]
MTPVAYLYAPHLAADIVQRSDPSVARRPLAILAAPEEETVADCSWEATRWGVRSGTSLRQAHLACPGLEVRVCPDAHIQAHLATVWDALVRAGCLVEPDPPYGAFVGPADATAPEALASVVEQALPAVWVLGAGPTRLMAKAAALEQAEHLHRHAAAGRLRAGGVVVRVIRPDEARAFLEGLPLRHLWLCPDPIRDELIRLGFKTVGAVAALPGEALMERFGPIGWQIWQKSRGIDSREVLAAYPPPSLSRVSDLEGEALTWEQGDGLALRVRQWARALHAELQARTQVAQALAMRLWLRPPAMTLVETIRLGEDRQGAGSWEIVALHLLDRLRRQAEPWQASGARPHRLELVAAPIRPARPQPVPLLPRLSVASRQSRLHRALQAVTQRVGPGAVRPASERPLSRRESMLSLIEQGAGLP